MVSKARYKARGELCWTTRTTLLCLYCAYLLPASPPSPPHQQQDFLTGSERLTTPSPAKLSVKRRHSKALIYRGVMRGTSSETVDYPVPAGA